jgi:phosphotriesterase-related protein
MARLTRDEMRGKAQTVLGLIDPAELGSTLMHEHLIWNITPPPLRSDPPPPAAMDLHQWWDLSVSEVKNWSNTTQLDVGVATRAAAEVVQKGGRTIVELTIGGLMPNPEGLAQVSRDSGAQIVMGCGHYVHDYQDPANEHRGVEELAQEMVDQIQLGAWGTDVRAGLLGEIGCQWPWTDLEKKMLHAACLAQQETGAALTIHPARHQDHPWMLVEFLREYGANLSRTIIDHIDRTIFDDDRLFRLADAGVILEWDLFGQESCYYAPNIDIDMPNDAQRLRDIRKIIDRGQGDQIVISHDICHTVQMTEHGGWGYAHIYKKVLPLARRRGFTEAELDQIMVHTPRRLLTFI